MCPGNASKSDIRCIHAFYAQPERRLVEIEGHDAVSPSETYLRGKLAKVNAYHIMLALSILFRLLQIVGQPTLDGCQTQLIFGGLDYDLVDTVALGSWYQRLSLPSTI